MSQSADNTRLPYRFFSVQGDDAEKFLQGQLSCDLLELGNENATYGTANTPKGRMYGLFRIIRWEHGFLLRVHESLLQRVMQNLGKYKVFFKCEMQEEAAFCAYGMVGKPKGSNTSSGEPNSLARQDEGFYLRQHDTEERYEVWSTMPPVTSEVFEPAERWQTLETLAGMPELFSDTSDTFILQHLNLQNYGAVSFKKGCYTGQEIIARMKFLGKIKKRAFSLHSSTPLNSVQRAECLPGSKLLNAQGEKCGQVVRVHSTADLGTAVLGVLDISHESTPQAVFLEVSDSPMLVSETET